ncbi:hypothetical protein H5410_042491 [Solanum commersonii]|uniref:Ulp1 protease family, C-terminal catalytic domain containing protein n=1 Tax=Solanum commersonii TaxID=4109 RepID=A0A9J5XUW0_SOLCO|nr:hypothetical protein H5410_042491 [Solanum commersonii]
MRSRHKENNYVDHQSSNKQPSPHIRIDLADAVGVANCDVGLYVNEGGHKVNVNAEIDHTISNQQPMKHVSELQPIYESIHVDTEANDPKKDDEAHHAPQDLNEVIMDEDGADTVQHNIRHFVPDKITVDTSDSSTSTTISPSTQAAIDALYIRSRKRCGIAYQALSKIIDEYMQWLTKDLVKNHANKKSSEDKYRSKASCFEFEMMNFVVAFPINKNWFYAKSQQNKY